MARFGFLAALGAAVAAGLALCGVSTTAMAQAWPARPVTFVVGYAPGGTMDTISRLVAAALEAKFGKPFPVENRGGASGTIALNAVANSPPDGYTIHLMAASTLIAAVFQNAPVDQAKSMTPIVGLYDAPLVAVVNSSVPVTTWPELIDYLKKNPETAYTSTGVGSMGHLGMEALAKLAGVKVLHVPARGGAPAMAETLAGRVPLAFNGATEVLPHIKAGTIRPVAATTVNRISSLPDVPTIAEQGFPGFDAAPFGGLVAPPGTPAAIVEALAKAGREIVDDPAFRARLVATGNEPHYRPTAAFAKDLEQSTARWAKVIAENNIKP